MEVFESLVGNEPIKETLGQAILQNRFLHAYIIEGPRGSGKHLTALLASSAILCKDEVKRPCLHCEICHKIMTGNAPDVQTYEAFKVDEVRSIKESLYQSPTEFDYKIYILSDTQKMNIKAQNALLISLEEPPKNVIFFLLCEDSSALLETIRSRAQILKTKPLSKEQILSYIDKNKIAVPHGCDLDEISVSSGGSLGTVLSLLDEKNAVDLKEKREKALSLAKALLTDSENSLIFLSSLFSMTREDLKDLFTLTQTVLRDMTACKKSENVTLLFFPTADEAKRESQSFPVKKILTVFEEIGKTPFAFEINASVPLLLTSLYAKVHKKG